MLIIAHRGNLNGPDTLTENTIESIDKSIKSGFMVEIDIRVIDNKIYLGHDNPSHLIDLDYIKKNRDKLIIHCKNKEALALSCDNNLHYFWHQDDDYTITSNGYIWIHYGKDIPTNKKTIYVLPELAQNIKLNCEGVCTDFPLLYHKII